MDNLREVRKIDHIRQTLALEDGPQDNGFSHVHLIHNALPALNVEEIDLSLSFLGKKVNSPLLINAITGGHQSVTEINRRLAQVAARKGLALAVGSQSAGLRNPELWSSYSVVRENHPDGVIIANVNADTTVTEALRAIEVIEADGIQVHLNVAQELAMKEGDRHFRDWIKRISDLVQHSPVPVIVKEVGFGISKEVAFELLDRGVTYIDVGGAGGTNFVSIELRRQSKENRGFESWGIPTAMTLGEVIWAYQQKGIPFHEGAVIATGGIRNGWEAAKALAMGATAFGMAGSILKRLLLSVVPSQEERLIPQSSDLNGRIEAVEDYIDDFEQELLQAMVLTGSQNLQDLHGKPCIFTGRVKEWFEQREIVIQRNR
ncbi:type 2 isopentenyl-diphosphate Delta-isomerase [Heliorestis convoluta]|uniref:Isopentenyl-diphosphate delta-isomerase n=1 Tax=Heliorestis convoluta TaxID=356322 RepID=A0A5Q2N1S2_9FIRM|nr:type 2 isopentenyl-diphosphate Delta-isomerase [Heliorestis convoluta]QGG47779.1 isopentenyl-diphosphate delta-isomerase, type 2 [Heliorestis convoluta]